MSKPLPSVKAKFCRFNFQQIATALVKYANLHEGYWQVQVTFGHSAANLNINGRISPTSIVQIGYLQLGRVDALDELSVDAAIVNPRSRIIAPTSVN